MYDASFQTLDFHIECLVGEGRGNTSREIVGMRLLYSPLEDRHGVPILALGSRPQNRRRFCCFPQIFRGKSVDKFLISMGLSAFLRVETLRKKIQH